MFTRFTSLLLSASQVVLLATPLVAGAQDTNRPPNWPTSKVLQTEGGQIIPAGAFGIVRIDAPRVATLLQLRGVVGRGRVFMRSLENDGCLSLPLRFVAGDFGGDNISAHTAVPIRLIIQTAGVAKALAGGGDVVSDMYRISSQKNDANADIIIESGLSESHGFVLNPGTSIVSDIFGTTASRMACSELQGNQAG